MFVFGRHFVFLSVALCLLVSPDCGHVYAEKNVNDPKEKADVTIKSESLFNSDVENNRNDKDRFSDRNQFTKLFPKRTGSQKPASVNHKPVDINSSYLLVDHVPIFDGKLPGIFTSASAYNVSSTSALHSKQKQISNGFSKDRTTLKSQRLTYKTRNVNLPTTTLYDEIIGTRSSHISNISQRNRKYSNIRNSPFKNKQNKAITTRKIDQNKTTNKSILIEASPNMHKTTMGPDHPGNRAPNQAPNEGPMKRTFLLESQHRTKQFIVSKNVSQQRPVGFPGNYLHFSNSSFRSEIGHSLSQNSTVMNVYERLFSAVSPLSVTDPLSEMSANCNGNHPHTGPDFNKKLRFTRQRLHSKKRPINKTILTKRAALFYDKTGLSFSDINYIETFLRYKSELLSQNVSNSLASCDQIARSATVAMKVMKSLLNIRPDVDLNTGDGEHRARSARFLKGSLDHKMHFKIREKVITDLLLLYRKCMNIVRHGSLLLQGKDDAVSKTRRTMIDTLYPENIAGYHDLEKTSTDKGNNVSESKLPADIKTFDHSHDLKMYHSATKKTDSVNNIIEFGVKEDSALNKNVEMYHRNEGNEKGFSKIVAMQHQGLNVTRLKEIDIPNGNTRRLSNFRHSRMLTRFLPGKKRQNLLHSLYYNFSYKNRDHAGVEGSEIIGQMQEKNNFKKHKHEKSTVEGEKTDNTMEIWNTERKHDDSTRTVDGGDVGVGNLHSNDAVVSLDGELNAKELISQQHRRLQEGADDNEDYNWEGYTRHARSLKHYEEFTIESRDYKANKDMSTHFQDFIVQNPEKNRLVNAEYDDSYRNQMLGPGQVESDLPFLHDASEVDNNQAHSASDMSHVSTPIYENNLNADNDFSNVPNVGYGSLTQFQFNTYEDLRGDGDGHEGGELPSYRSFSRFEAHTDMLPAHQEPVRMKSVENGQYGINSEDRGRIEINSEDSGQFEINGAENVHNRINSPDNGQYRTNSLNNGYFQINNAENGQYRINSAENGQHRIIGADNRLFRLHREENGQYLRNSARNGQSIYSNVEDFGNMLYNSITTTMENKPSTYPRYDNTDEGSNGGNAGSGIKALPKRVKRSIALSFDKPSTTSSLPPPPVETSPTPTTGSQPTSSPPLLDVINNEKILSSEASHVLSPLSTESPLLYDNCLTAAMQGKQSTSTESASDIDMKQIDQPKPILKIGVILAYSHRFPWVINKTHPAIETAADFVSSPDGPLSNFKIEIQVRDSRCSDTFGSLEGIDLYVKKLANVFIGPSCDYSIAPLARFSYYWKIPILTAGALVEAFANKDEYKLLTRVQGSYTKSAEFFVSIALTHGWSHVGLVYHEVKYDGRGSRSNCAFTIEPIFYSVEQFLKSKPWHVSFNEKEATEDTIMSVMKQLSVNCRIVVLCASPSTVREIMIKAHELNFDNGEYVFFNIDLFSSKNASETPWFRPDDTAERNAKARKAYESLMTVTLRMPTSTEYREFSNEVKARAAEMYPNFTYGEDEVNSFVGAFHDAVLLYALALNETLAENGSISDGEAITRRMWNRTFTGITGNVSIDPNGDRNADYSLLDLNPENGKFEVVANYFGNKRKYEPVPGKAIHWAGGRQGPPPDTPTCGFDGSKCPPDEPFPEYGIVIIVLGTLLLLVLIVVFSIYRHIKLEAELAEMNWRVRWDDILFGVLEKNKKMDRQGSRLSLGRSSVSTGCSGDTIAVHLNDARNRQLFTKTGYYKGAIIAIKPVNRNNITITKPMLLEIKRMKDLQNDHIVRFIGACIDCSNCCILTEYCPKGSLQDVLENDQIKLDWMFRYSIMQDIVRGMAYLQGTEIHSHGNLKSSNCVVDSRFVVKITDFGLHHLRGTANPSEEDKQNYSYYQSTLWTAPELLRMTYRPPEGSIKGDVYSFAIICQEIVYRNGVFYIQHYDLSPQEIYQKVKLGLKPYFRPTLEEFDCPCDELAGVIRRCWTEDPADRPDFQALKSIIRKLNRDGDKGNILDNLLSRMEQYANNLEALVEERTADYLQQKKKAEDLLYNMLPKKVASQLIRGESVTAEWYDNVSIYFSDICGFTALSAESTPMEVVDLLNDLYTTFDSIIENFDVYKVETIGDAYMVVSGLPDRNGNIHAREIARMSLSLQKATLTFRIRHRPNDQIKIRIGIHTGPVCAGVVGLKMPRYCLFGDTVNTASRMESNGLPLKIHVSPQCKEVLDYFGSFELELRGNVEMKGKGQVKTYWLLGEKNNSDSPGVSLNIL